MSGLSHGNTTKGNYMDTTVIELPWLSRLYDLFLLRNRYYRNSQYLGRPSSGSKWHEEIQLNIATP